MGYMTSYSIFAQELKTVCCVQGQSRDTNSYSILAYGLKAVLLLAGTKLGHEQS
jgi:hypothetical protein